MASQFILVVDDEPDIRQLVSEILQDEGYEVAVAENAEQATKLRRKRRPDLVLLDIWMPGEDGISLLKSWKKSGSLCCPVIMMSGHGTIETAVEATRLGAHDFIEKPLSMAKMLLTIDNALRAESLAQENKDLREQVNTITSPIGSSEIMKTLREQARRIAQHNDVVLIYGESGVGKDVFARYIHSHSKNSDRPFVKASVSSLNEINSKEAIFGKESKDKVHYGLLDDAGGGCLYLSDIGELSEEAQQKLLNTLQEDSYTRVGGKERINLSSILIVSSQHDLRDDVEEGVFSSDLFQQLNAMHLLIPSLREHQGDVPELLNYYVDQLTDQDGLPYRHFSVSAQNFLRNHQWFGNIRELRNLVQRLLIMGVEAEIDQEEVELSLGAEIPIFQHSKSDVLENIFSLPLRQAREQFEHDYIDYQLKQVDGNVSKLAEVVQMERTHLYRKMRSLDIDPKKYGK